MTGYSGKFLSNGEMKRVWCLIHLIVKTGTGHFLQDININVFCVGGSQGGILNLLWPVPFMNL